MQAGIIDLNSNHKSGNSQVSLNNTARSKHKRERQAWSVETEVYKRKLPAGSTNRVSFDFVTKHKLSKPNSPNLLYTLLSDVNPIPTACGNSLYEGTDSRGTTRRFSRYCVAIDRDRKLYAPLDDQNPRSGFSTSRGDSGINGLEPNLLTSSHQSDVRKPPSSIHISSRLSKCPKSYSYPLMKTIPNSR